MAKRLQIKQKATETKSHIFVRNHKTEFLEHTYNYCIEKGISTKGEKIEEPINKAGNDAILSAKMQGEQTHQTQQENAIQRKIKHIQYVPNDELTNYINKTKNTMYFVAYPTKIMSLNMVI